MPATSYPPAGTFDPNNGYIYVANAGNGTVSVISSSTNTVLAVLRVGSLWSSPSPPVLDPANGELLVSLESQNTVVIISGETVVATLPVGVAGSDPLTPVFDSQNADIYVPTDASGFVSVISGATNTVVANVTVGTGIVGAAFDPMNGDIYLTNCCLGPGSVLIIAGETNALVGNITLDFPTCPLSPRPLTVFVPCTNDGPSLPVFDQANGDIYVSNGGGDTVSVISGATNSLVPNVVVGGGPATPTIDPANGDIYVPNYYGSSVSVISGATNALVATIKVGVQPEQPVINPTNGDIYVPNAAPATCAGDVCFVNSTLSVISGATNTVIATVQICSGPNSPPAYDSSDGDVYVSCGGGTVWVISSTTLESSTATTSTTLGHLVYCDGGGMNASLNTAPKPTVYVKVVTDQGTVITNGTLLVDQLENMTNGEETAHYCTSLSDVQGTGYVRLADLNQSGSSANLITGGYYNVTVVAGLNNQGPWYMATIPSIQLGPNSTVYVTVSVPSGAVTIVTSNEGSSSVTTTTTTATTTTVNGP
jgi:YVTN family beta-propeller protein